MIWYAVFTFLCGFAQNFEQLFLFRALQGLGFGGEWAAGAVLMGEVIRDKYRGRAVGIVQTGWAIGWGAAALLYTIFFAILPEAHRLAGDVLDRHPARRSWCSRSAASSMNRICRATPRPVGTALTQIFAALKPPYLATTLARVADGDRRAGRQLRADDLAADLPQDRDGT